MVARMHDSGYLYIRFEKPVEALLLAYETILV